MLFQNIEIGGMRLKNRIVMPPMCMYSAKTDGFVLPFHVVHYGTRAQGGVGLIIQEATAVEARGRISANDLGIWQDEQIEGLGEIVKIVHGFNSKIAIQLAHAGRKSEVGPVVSCTTEKFSDHYQPPANLTTEEVSEVVRAFGQAARRALEAGYDAVEIHGAHGYLINQFLSPLTNHREDKYGCKEGIGAQFLMEIIQTVKKNFNRPVGLRISAESYIDNGLHPENYIKLIHLLQNNPKTAVDFLDVSSGGITPDSLPPSPVKSGYQIPFAAQIKKNDPISIPIIAGGLLMQPTQCESILKEGKADLVWLGRELLRNPYWSLQAAEKLNTEIEKPVQYKRAEPYLHKIE